MIHSWNSVTNPFLYTVEMSTGHMQKRSVWKGVFGVDIQVLSRWPISNIFMKLLHWHLSQLRHWLMSILLRSWMSAWTSLAPPLKHSPLEHDLQSAYPLSSHHALCSFCPIYLRTFFDTENTLSLSNSSKSFKSSSHSIMFHICKCEKCNSYSVAHANAFRQQLWPNIARQT